MRLRNTTERYGAVSLSLHWLMALMIIGLLVLGLYMTAQPDGDSKWSLYGLHKSFGMLAFVLVVVRITWVISHPKPGLPNNLNPWERSAARATHGFLYLSMILLPVSGYVDSSAGGYHLAFFDLFDIPKLITKDKGTEELAVLVHSTLAYGVIGVLVLHMGAVAKHHFILRDGVLRRMLP